MTDFYIFCSDPLNERHPDPIYDAEVEAVKQLFGEYAYALIDFDALTAGNAEQAVRRIALQPIPLQAVYRGWMLKPNQYFALHDALYEKNILLINTPEMYIHCHYLPENYPIIEPFTPHSVWMPYHQGTSIESVVNLAAQLGNTPVIVKDYVKSQKHYWHEACYIPNATISTEVERVVHRFLELQATDLNEGIVFREFIEFEPLTQHSHSGMPLVKEFRIFVLHGEPVFVTQYWSEGEYSTLQPPIQQFTQLMKQVKSRFYTMDVAKRLNGDWMIVELGDAQVAGVPEHVAPLDFYERLR